MKIYEIMDEELACRLGVLLYYDKSQTFLIELEEYLDEWTAPLLFSGFVKRKQYTIPRDISLLWVRERIIPPSRQNIAMILKTHHLKEYDEMKFLELSGGRCAQDALYIRKLTQLPHYVQERQKRNLKECCALSRNVILCIFADGSVQRVDLSSMKDTSGIDKILRNESLFASVCVGTGGYYATFADSIDISADMLYKTGKKIGLSAGELYMVMKRELMDTTEACDLLQNSRQNLSYLAKQKRLLPVKEGVRGNLYLKGDVIKNTW